VNVFFMIKCNEYNAYGSDFAADGLNTLISCHWPRSRLIHVDFRDVHRDQRKHLQHHLSSMLVASGTPPHFSLICVYSSLLFLMSKTTPT